MDNDSSRTPPDREGVARGGLVALAPRYPGSRVLVVGRDARALATTASYFGSRVSHFSGLAGLDRGRRSAMARATGSRLFDFDDDSFDAVVLNGALEGAAEIAGAERSAERILADCRRVLKPGGALVLAVENRIAIDNLRARRHPVTGLPFPGLLPSWLASAVPAGRGRRSAYRMHSGWKWQSLLEDAGFRIDSVRTTWPSFFHWRRLSPVSDPPASWFRSARRRNLAGRVKDIALRTLNLLGAGRWGAPGFVFVARRPGAPAEEMVPLIEQILEAEGGSGAVVAATLQPNSISLTFTAGTKFIKVPLSERASLGVSACCRALDALSNDEFARHLPVPVARRQAGGVPYVVFPALPAAEPRDPRAVEDGIARILDLLSRTRTIVPLEQTDLWARINAPEIRSRIVRLGGGAVLAHLARVSAGRRVPAGPTHGDLHPANIVVGRDRLFLVDWDRFEPRSPQFLDSMEVAIASVPRRADPEERDPMLAAIRVLLAERRRPAPLARVESLRGELRLDEVVSLYVLHRAGWTIHFHPLVYEHDRRLYRRRFSFCAGLLGRERAGARRRVG